MDILFHLNFEKLISSQILTSLPFFYLIYAFSSFDFKELFQNLINSESSRKLFFQFVRKKNHQKCNILLQSSMITPDIGLNSIFCCLKMK